MKNKILTFVKKIHLVEILFIALLYYGKLLMYKASNRINTDSHFINMKIDELIPFCKYFVFFYFTYYWFSQLQLWIISYGNRRKFYRMLISAFITCVICNICFICYQVEMSRPQIIGNDFFSKWVNWVYNHDPKALNCFPSIHAVMGMLMIIGGTKSSNLPKWFNIISIVFGVGCIFSTVFIKQHYFIDMVVGTILSALIYFIVCIIDKKIVKKKEEKLES